MIYSIIYFSQRISIQSSNLWLVTTILTYFNDLFIITPILILIRWIILNTIIIQDVQCIMKKLNQHARLILMRSSYGVMRYAECEIQKLNSACYLARMLPILPISRLLISINITICL